MRRRLFNLAAAVSLVLCVATTALWVRTRWWNDGVLYVHVTAPPDGSDIRRFSMSLMTAGSQIAVIADRDTTRRPAQYYDLPAGRLIHTVEPRTNVVFAASGGRLERYGFGWGFDRAVGQRHQEMPYLEWRASVFAPLWFVFAVTVILPSVSFVSRVRRKRRKLGGHCPACGYDLRATPQEGGALLDRCPECGAQAKQAKPRPADGIEQ